jgi:MFS family permease
LCARGIQQAPLVIVADVTAEESRGASMGIFRFFSDVGSLLGPLALGLVANAFGLSAPFYAMGAIIFLIAALISCFGVETLSHKNAEKHTPKQSESS